MQAARHLPYRPYLLLFDRHTADDVCLSVLCSDIARNRNYCRTGSN